MISLGPATVTWFLLRISVHWTLVLAARKDKCDQESLAVYSIILETRWTRELFPKQYPEWRPPAQWSKLVGRSHNARLKLFSEGDAATDGLKTFAETGASDALDTESQSQSGVYDEFHGPAVTSGRGRTETEFFLDGNHTKVSVVVRMVPSPDWFIGLDSLNLCEAGYWVDTISVEVDPLDAGTDNGFTFTSPNWPSEPRRKVTRITAHVPNHPASSFHYPLLERLPAIGTFTLSKVKMYKLTGVSNHLPPQQPNPRIPGDISNDVSPLFSAPQQKPHKVAKKRRNRKGPRRPVACTVGSWSSWSACSTTCGTGENLRTRGVTKHARRGGRTCPHLEETRLCNQKSSCSTKFFNWS